MSIIQENRAYWNQRAATYSEVNQEELGGDHRHNWKSVINQEIESQFPGVPKEQIRVLEVGTGPGFFAIILAEEGYNVTAIDLTPNMLAEARKNAGSLAQKIRFMEMNAEELEFTDESFHVIVTRNLTWNLPHPEQGYRHWCRVLKKNGILLNFDASWYGYLYDEKAKEAYELDRANSAAQGMADQNVGENFDVMESIAKRIPLSGAKRPEWDLGVLGGLGMKAVADRNIWQKVWSHQEKTNFSSTPMFMIRAVR